MASPLLRKLGTSALALALSTGAMAASPGYVEGASGYERADQELIGTLAERANFLRGEVVTPHSGEAVGGTYHTLARTGNLDGFVGAQYGFGPILPMDMRLGSEYLTCGTMASGSFRKYVDVDFERPGPEAIMTPEADGVLTVYPDAKEARGYAETMHACFEDAIESLEGEEPVQKLIVTLIAG